MQQDAEIKIANMKLTIMLSLIMVFIINLFIVARMAMNKEKIITKMKVVNNYYLETALDNMQPNTEATTTI